MGGGTWPTIVAAWPAVLSNEVSLCRHCHPVDGALDPSPFYFNLLADMNKEVEKSAVASDCTAKNY